MSERPSDAACVRALDWVRLCVGPWLRRVRGCEWGDGSVPCVQHVLALWGCMLRHEFNGPEKWCLGVCPHGASPGAVGLHSEA